METPTLLGAIALSAKGHLSEVFSGKYLSRKADVSEV
jgi:hypothetical protein